MFTGHVKIQINGCNNTAIFRLIVATYTVAV